MAGTDTLNYSDAAGAKNINGLGLTLNSIETINVRSTGAATATTTGFTGVENVNVLVGTSAAVVAGSTTAASVVGVSGGIAIDGGSTQTVTTAGTTVTLGATTGAAGAINVTHTAQAANAIAIDGGTTVNVTSSGRIAAGTITIGADLSPILPTGAVTVTASEGLASGGTAAAIRVDGGSSVTITENITGSAAAITAASTSGAPGDVAGAAIAVNAGTTTTSVSVTQTKSVAAVAAVAGAAAVKETSTVTFGAIATAGDSVTVNGLTFTAAKALTAAEVAAAFGSLTAADTQTASGPVANGVFTGSSATAAWVSGAASGVTVAYSAAVAGTAPAALTISNTGTAVLPTATAPTTGVTAATAKTGVLGVINGAVTINDNAAAAITTVSVDGYATSTIGAGTTLSKLATLSLANSGGAAAGDTDGTMDVNAAGVTSLALNLNAVKGAVTLDAGGASIKTLAVTTATADSAFALTAAAVETLTVAGTKAASFTDGDLALLKTVTVSGSAGLTLTASVADTITSVNTSATTGAVTATISGATATYTGGAGIDKVTLSATTVAKNMTLGGGNDTLDGSLATLTGTFTIDGGADTDTLALTAAQAASLSGSTAFRDKIAGFERLTIGNAAAQEVVDLANLDDINYVKVGTSTATAQVGTITVGGTVQIGDIFTSTVNGTTYSFTATAATILNAITGLQAAVAAGTPAGITVGAVAGGTNFALTAATAGVPFTASVVTTEAGGGAAAGQTLAIAATTANAYGITLNNLASAGTVVLTDAGSVIANIKDATTGLTDVLNVLTTSNNNTAYGQLTANKVETINVTVDDTDNDTTGDSETLTLAADSVTKITVANSGDIVVVAGVSQPDITKLNLTVTGATALATVDASAMLGVFTYTASNGTTTVTGGAGKDALTGSGSSDVLIGGAGNDTLTGANLTTLTGGLGNDIFMMNKPTNVNSYSSITDFTTGDVIDLDGANAGTVVFTKSAITLAGTAVFQDFANAAVNALSTDVNNAAWFQFGTNTYIVQSGDTTAGNDFQNGVDSIIQIVGLVNLSTASYNQSNGTLESA